MSLPRFAIVTPSYNQAEFLEQTILSVLQQRGRGVEFELEYAVVDGGSTDSSADIIRKYESELTFWCSEKDRGQTHAINKGFQRVQGTIHAYINSDDYYLSGAFSKVAEVFQNRDDTDFVHGICQKVDANGAVFKEQISHIKSLSEMVNLWDYWLRPKENWNFIQPEVFWSANLANQLGKFDESLHYTMDFDYWLRGFDAGMIVTTLDKPLAAFRVHEDQKTSQQDESIRELIQQVEPYLDRNDERLDKDFCDEMRRLMSLARCRISHTNKPHLKQFVSLVSLLINEPRLIESRHYWKQFRRSGRRILFPNRKNRASMKMAA